MDYKNEENKWPSPITFDDDDPVRGIAYVKLTIPNLSVKRGRFYKCCKENNAIVKFSCLNGMVTLHVTVTHMGEVNNYEYSKSMPEDINEAKSKYKVKNGMITLELVKMKSESWAQHRQYMIERPND